MQIRNFHLIKTNIMCNMKKFQTVRINYEPNFTL